MLHRTVRERVVELTRWHAKLEGACAATADEVAELRSRLDALPATIPERGAIPWRALGTQGRRQELGELAAWATWVVNAYDLQDRWPACWYQHEGLVELLGALRRWHVALTTELIGDAPAATLWHEALYRTVDRTMLAVTQRCLTSHRETMPLAPPDEADLLAASNRPSNAGVHAPPPGAT
jgi:hypothetical protein